MGTLEKSMRISKIKISDLVVGYEAQAPLNSVPWNLEWDLTDPSQPSQIAILGENGKGKTTLLKALLGEKVILSGKIDWESDSPKAIKSPIVPTDYCSYLPQEMTFDPQMRVGTFIELAWFSLLRFWKKPSGEMKEKFQQVSEEWGVAELIEKPLGELSSGQRQRASLARVVLQDRSILILDEPTSYLDVQGKEKFWKWLAALPAHKKVFLVTHEHTKRYGIPFCLPFVNSPTESQAE